MERVQRHVDLHVVHDTIIMEQIEHVQHVQHENTQVHEIQVQVVRIVKYDIHVQDERQG